MEKLPRIAIIYLSYHSEPYWDNVLRALKKITYPKDRVLFIIVDNPHSEHGLSKQYIEEQVLPLSQKEFPEMVYLPQATNLGFAAGNNAGMRYALEHDCEYVYLHNQDGFMDADCLSKLVLAMTTDPMIGAVQSLLLLYPETNLINSAGNAYHFLGLGYCNYFRVPTEQVALAPACEAGYASGASLLLKGELVERHGLLDKDFISYHEDLEYSLRLKSRGYKIILASEAIFYHQYNFSRNKDKYYLMERNRFAVLVMYYKLPTLILIFPALILSELGLLLFAWQHGWFEQKLRAYRYWLKTEQHGEWLKKRKHIQATRVISDRQLFKQAVGKVIFDSKEANHWLVRLIANPIMAAYWWLVKKMIFW